MGRPHRLGPLPPPEWGCGGGGEGEIDCGGEHIRILYKAPKDYTKTYKTLCKTPNTKQSRDRLFKAPPKIYKAFIYQTNLKHSTRVARNHKGYYLVHDIKYGDKYLS